MRADFKAKSSCPFGLQNCSGLTYKAKSGGRGAGVTAGLPMTQKAGSSHILCVQPWSQPAAAYAQGHPDVAHSRARRRFCVFKKDISSSVFFFSLPPATSYKFSLEELFLNDQRKTSMYWRKFRKNRTLCTQGRGLFLPAPCA